MQIKDLLLAIWIMLISINFLLVYILITGQLKGDKGDAGEPGWQGPMGAKGEPMTWNTMSREDKDDLCSAVILYAKNSYLH